MSEDSTPGLFQESGRGIVLAHVTHYEWDGNGHGYLIVSLVSGAKIELYSSDEIYATSGPDAKRTKRVELGQRFIRALNLYWESRTRDTQLR